MNVLPPDIITNINSWNLNSTTPSDADMPKELIAARHVLEEKFVNVIKKAQSLNLETCSDQELIDLYTEVKDTESFYDSTQLTAKVNANSLYGYLGATFAKIYNKVVAADITADGRNLLKMIDKYVAEYFERGWQNEIDFFNKMKKKYPNLIGVDKPVSVKYPKEVAVYGDTDSLFLKLDLFIEKHKVQTMNRTEDVTMFIKDMVEGPLMTIINKLMENYIKNRNGDNFYVFELEAILRRGIFLKKKKYVASYLLKDGVYIAKELKLKATGIALSQKTTPEPIKNDIKKLVYYLLAANNLDEKTMFQLFRLLVKKYQDIHPDEWVKSRSLGKFNNYFKTDKRGLYYPLKRADKVTKGAIWYNNEIIRNNLQREYPLIKQGNKVKYYVAEDGRTFSYPITDESRFPEKIAPEINVRESLKGLLFDPVKRIMIQTTDSDLSLIGSDVFANKITMFKKPEK